MPQAPAGHFKTSTSDIIVGVAGYLSEYQSTCIQVTQIQTRH